MKLVKLILVAAAVVFAVSPAFAQRKVANAYQAQFVDFGGSCGSHVAVASIELGGGKVAQAREGDIVCLVTPGGDVDCGQAFAAASASYTCPTNGSGVDCATECGDCATGTGTAADCKACCDHFHSGASAISCKRHYC